MVAEGFEVNGHKITAQVDTLYTGSLLIYNDSFAGWDWTWRAAGPQKYATFLAPNTDGGVKMKEAYAQEEKFGGTGLGGTRPTRFSRSRRARTGRSFDATIGLELMRDSVVSLDFHSLTISIRRQGRDGPGFFTERSTGQAEWRAFDAQIAPLRCDPAPADAFFCTRSNILARICGSGKFHVHQGDLTAYDLRDR